MTRVPVYQWELPEDLEPLRSAVRGIAGGEFDVALFTTATQIVHLMKVAGTMDMADAVREGLRRMVIASIGPTTSEELRQQGLTIDLEPSHPKMGFLVREAAEQAPGLLLKKARVGLAPGLLLFGPHDGPRGSPAQERRLDQRIDDPTACRLVHSPQPCRLCDRQLEPRHFVELAADTLEQQ